MESTADKVIIVTGASSGIGLYIADKAMELGMKVVMAARNMEAMREHTLAKNWKSDRYLLVKTDVSSEDDCRSLINKTTEKFGAIDILVNNAGISMRALFADLELSVMKKLMDVNFWGTVYCTHYALPWLLKRKGSVVGVSSIAGHKGLPARTGYSASKFAMHGFLESLRIENLKTGLHVLLACPGFTASNIRKTALDSRGEQQGESPRDEKSMMQPQKVAELILKATLKRKNNLTLTAQGKTTVWLNKLFPSLADKLVYNHMAKEPDSPFK